MQGVADSFGTTDKGIYYMIHEVGVPLDPLKMTDVRAAFDALVGIHSGGKYHGDARFINAIAVVENGRRIVKWGDFMQFSKFLHNSIEKIKLDFTSFTKSIGRGSMNKVSDGLWQEYIRNRNDNGGILYDVLFG